MITNVLPFFMNHSVGRWSLKR